MGSGQPSEASVNPHQHGNKSNHIPIGRSTRAKRKYGRIIEGASRSIQRIHCLQKLRHWAIQQPHRTIQLHDLPHRIRQLRHRQHQLRSMPSRKSSRRRPRFGLSNLPSWDLSTLCPFELFHHTSVPNPILFFYLRVTTCKTNPYRHWVLIYNHIRLYLYAAGGCCSTLQQRRFLYRTGLIFRLPVLQQQHV